MSPRPKKPRNCACPHRPPGSSVFKPAGIPMTELERIFLHYDELEALRLCDGEGLTQAAAGAMIGVSRGTVQRLVASGRQKMVAAVVECRALIVEEAAPDEN
ncbi:MAG: DUF134 domain-containing protein [Desulfuromonadales bacterium]